MKESWFRFPTALILGQIVNQALWCTTRISVCRGGLEKLENYLLLQSESLCFDSCLWCYLQAERPTSYLVLLKFIFIASKWWWWYLEMLHIKHLAQESHLIHSCSYFPIRMWQFKAGHDLHRVQLLPLSGRASQPLNPLTFLFHP